jgi:hypothetical protein
MPPQVEEPEERRAEAVPGEPARVIDVVGRLDRQTFLLRHAPALPAVRELWRHALARYTRSEWVVSAGS